MYCRAICNKLGDTFRKYYYGAYATHKPKIVISLIARFGLEIY